MDLRELRRAASEADDRAAITKLPLDRKIAWECWQEYYRAERAVAKATTEYMRKVWDN